MVDQNAALSATNQGRVARAVKAEEDIHQEILSAAGEGRVFIETQRLAKETLSVRDIVAANLKIKGYKVYPHRQEWGWAVNYVYHIYWGPRKPWWKFW